MGSFLAWLRRTFVRGILLILPLAITWIILRWLFGLIAGFSTPGAERLLRVVGAPIVDTPLFTYLTPAIAFVITVGVVILVGLIGGNYAGKMLYESFEQVLLRVPLVRWFYGASRQLIEAFRASGTGVFREVVLIEYPRRGIWALGFVTAEAAHLNALQHGEDLLYVFLPTSPNPTSGYTVVIPRREAVPARMTVDEGLKVIISGGFVTPDPAQAIEGDGTAGASATSERADRGRSAR
ncbi:MAG TPA: DUF502 domain-containing protein [Candidatus Polarisedimenticolia bacterium]|nr:DUF502 domain-containing protein [Candidatus Polarisedimenticolia bacterium]